jgi:RNA polymerase sigma factor (sigma-70 family)
MTGPSTVYLQGCLDRLRAGDAAAREQLLGHSQERLLALTRRMLRGYPALRRWEESGDVLQRVLMRLDRMLGRLEVATVQDYLCLAATNIRRVLIDLTRHYYGPQGLGNRQAAPLPPSPVEGGPETCTDAANGEADDPISLAAWAEFHERVSRMPEADCAIFDLLWYHELSHEEAAELLQISLRTLRRRWQAARVRLMEAFGGEVPF